MNLSILDLFILSMLDRGAQSGYDLQRQAGISLGASTPSLNRLLKSKFVSRQEGKSATNHRRFSFKLTDSGKQAARSGWKKSLPTVEQVTTDLDSILRIADMAAHYGADPQRIKSFLRSAGEARLLLADQAELAVRADGPNLKLMYTKMRARCDESRLRAEGNSLLLLAEGFKRPKGSAPGQQMIPGLRAR